MIHNVQSHKNSHALKIVLNTNNLLTFYGIQEFKAFHYYLFEFLQHFANTLTVTELWEKDEDLTSN